MKLKGVILDWAGTIADHGSRGPVEALREIFEAAGVPITVAEARSSMGIAKKSHIEAILALPRVREDWSQTQGAPPSAKDVDALYEHFIPRQIECLKRYSALIAGVPEAVERMRSRGLAIGTTTGYTRPMLDYLLARALEQGLQPDAALCPGDVPAGRPAPWMCYENAIRLEVYPMWAMVKIGDTPADIEEGLNAGMWTIGITSTGNEVGLTEEEWRQASQAEKLALVSSAERILFGAGAHYVAPGVAECDDILDTIDSSLSVGIKPW